MSIYTIKVCPEKISDNSIEYSNGRNVSVQEQDDGSFIVTVYVCPVGSKCHSGQYVTIKLCPVGENCGCNYETQISWKGYSEDRVLVEWTNPDKCILDRIELKAKPVWGESWDTIMKYIHVKSGDPSIIIYPDGDSRNEGFCHECGIGGENKHSAGQERIWDTGIVIPGMMYRVDGFFRNESCGGVTQPVPLGYALYETPAFTSGEIVGVVVDANGDPVDPPKYTVRLYENDVDKYPLWVDVDLFSVDKYPWAVGDHVMILKKQTEYPAGDSSKDDPDAPGGYATHRYDSSNTNRDADNLVISAYKILGVGA